MSDGEKIKFYGYGTQKDPGLTFAHVVVDGESACVGQFWLQQRLRSLQDLGLPHDVTERILAEWPVTETPREQRLEQALREIKKEAVPDMTWLAAEAIIKRIGEIAAQALREGDGA